MSFKKTIATLALTGLATLGFASVTKAREAVYEGGPEAHKLLVKAIRRNGVKITINHAKCVNGLMGFYSGKDRELVVCQDNGVANGPTVAWTRNDLDTLRHEAQHMIQDCVVGTNHDHQLSPVYNSPSSLARVKLGPERVAKITQVYRDKGASDLVLLLEYEAFAVAYMNIPLDQTKDIKIHCGV
jgi:hypothetical protein